MGEAVNMIATEVIILLFFYVASGCITSQNVAQQHLPHNKCHEQNMSR